MDSPTSTSATEDQQRSASGKSRRLRILNRQLNTVDVQTTSIYRMPCAAGVKQLPSFDPFVLETYLDELRDLKKQVYDVFKYQPELLPRVGEALSKEEHRELVRRQLRALLASGLNPLEYFDRDFNKYFHVAECLSMVDLSLMVKCGVQYSLWGGSVLNLGTAAHRQKYYQDIAFFRLPGCFAMTELKHGSNVAGLQTEAILDMTKDEWVINTPDEGAIKWWIGNAAEDGRAATVFARLKLQVADPREDTTEATEDDTRGPSRKSGTTTIDHGVHAFVVPLRDAQGHCLPGVEIRDCGYKVGLNGVDNGAIRFDHVRVPRKALLDRFASVDAEGQYHNALHSEGRRFGATLGELTGGRVGLTSGSLGVLKGAVTIAVRYCDQRAQFGPPGSPEVSVLDYQSTQARLMPILATTYALHFAKNSLVTLYCRAKHKGAAKALDAQNTSSEEATTTPTALGTTVTGGAPTAPAEARTTAATVAAEAPSVAPSTSEGIGEEVHALSAGLKAYTTSFTAAALSACRESCGGHGYAAVNRLGALRSDHDIFQTFEGDNTVLLQQVTGVLLKGYTAQFRDAPMSSSWAYLAQFVRGRLPANPLVSHDTDVRHLRDPSFLLGAMRYRTGRMLFTLALRLRKHRAAVGSFHAWNTCLNHVLALARAHVESVVLTAFTAGVAGCPDPGAQAALKALCDLFALTCIQGDALFRDEEYVAPAKAKAIQRLTTALCAEVRHRAVDLVQALAIPDAILRAPIGLGNAAAVDMYKEYLAAAGFDI